MELKNKIVFVSGANRSIGKALVEALLKRGVQKIYAAARKPTDDQFKDSRVTYVTLDITNKQQVADAAKLAKDTQILINNAGVASYGSAFEEPIETARKDMETNYFGTLAMMQNFIPVLEKNKGATIVNITSIASFVNFPMLGGYSASKAALFSLTQAARLELAAKKITVHSVNPGPIDTDMAKDIDMDKTSPADTAEAILDGVEKQEPDIFPDQAGRGMFDVWHKDYRDLEGMVAEMLKAA